MLLAVAAITSFLAFGPSSAAAQSAQVPVPEGSAPPQIDPPDKRIATTKIEATLKEKTASIQVYCFSRSARIWIDRNEIGWVPYLGDLEQGSHYIEVRIPGYYPLGHWFMLAEKTLYTMEFTPSRIIGKLELKVEPEDSLASVDGARVAPGVLELPAGRHRLEARRFGFEGKAIDFEVKENETQSISVSLAKASFAIEGFGFTRKTFNPRSSGATSSTSLEFRATSRGSARVEIRGADGVQVAAFDFPDIEDWSQSRGWDGRWNGGAPLPEGLYTARLIAKDAGSDKTVEAEAQVWIDSTLVVRPSGTASAVPGLLFMPDSVLPAKDAASVEAFYFVPPKASWRDSGESSFGIAGAFAISSGLELGLHASAELSDQTLGDGDLDGSFLVSLLGDRTTAWSGSFFLRGGYSSLSAPAMPAAGSMVEAAIPVGARLGSISKEADARASVAPGIRADFSGSMTWLATCRAAFWLEGRRFRTGVSGELPLGFEGGRASVFRAADAALEGRLLFGGGFALAGYATAEFPAGEAPAFGLGLGLGLLF